MSATMTLRQQAQECFQSLLALDEHAGARRELLAAGVAPHRVRALYGEEFEGLVPGLKLQFETESFKRACFDAAWLGPEQKVHQIRRNLFQEQLTPAVIEINRFNQTEGAPLYALLRMQLGPDFEFTKPLQLLWWAHWCMRNRTEILQQDLVDEVMIWVCEILLTLPKQNAPTTEAAGAF